MVVHARGILRGANIELDAPIRELPDGATVSVDLRPCEVPVEERRRMIAELCGAWSGDSSIGSIFDEIARSRHRVAPRPVDLDDPS